MRSNTGKLPLAAALAVPAFLVSMFPHTAYAQAGKPGGAPPPDPTKTSASTGTSSSTPAGQRAVTVNVPEPGPKFARIIPSSDAKQPAQLPIDFSDKKVVVTFDPATVGKSPKIAIDDAKTGNTAVKDIPENNELTLLRPDFDRVHVVPVKVTYDNKPVQVARVEMAPFDKVNQTKVIDASQQGIAVFNDVAAGKAKLNIVYGDNLTQTQDVVITTDHAAGPLSITASVSNKVPTLDVPGGAAVGTPAAQPGASSSATTPGTVVGPGSGSATPAPAPDAGGGISSLVGNLIALAVVGGGIYLFWKWFQSGGFAATMKKVGIEVNGPTPPSDAGTPWQPNAPAAPVVADPSVCQFCGMKKDAAGNCACTLSPGMASGASGLPAGAPGAAVASQPRLVATMGVYSGNVFPLNINGTGVTLGRDVTNSIPLDNDTTVSRRHAAIKSDHGSGGFVVSDEGSSNGVYVNGVRINGSQPLRPGDEVQIGNTRFRFEL